MYGMISKQPPMFFKRVVLKSFTNYTKILALESLFNKDSDTVVFL